MWVETLECKGRTPREMYRMFMDSKEISEITGYDTSVGEKAGDKFFALNGAVKGENLFIIPNRMIVQSWRWLTRKKEFSDSVLVIVFNESEKGTKIEISSINLQENEMVFINKETYLDPLMAHLERMAQDDERKIAREKEREVTRVRNEEKARKMAREKRAGEMAKEKRVKKKPRKKVPVKA